MEGVYVGGGGVPARTGQVGLCIVSLSLIQLYTLNWKWLEFYIRKPLYKTRLFIRSDRDTSDPDVPIQLPGWWLWSLAWANQAHTLQDH